MITISLLGIDQVPDGAGMTLQLLTADLDVVASAKADAMGVATFDLSAAEQGRVERVRFAPPRDDGTG